MNEDLEPLLQNVGDAVADLFEQLVKGNWTDDQGHAVTGNAAMQNMKNVLVAIARFRTKHLNYPEVFQGYPEVFFDE